MAISYLFIILLNRFIWKQKQGNGEAKEVEVTVYDYFTKHLKIALRYGDLRCISVGKPKRPNYIPIEVIFVLCLNSFFFLITFSFFLVVNICVLFLNIFYSYVILFLFNAIRKLLQLFRGVK